MQSKETIAFDRMALAIKRLEVVRDTVMLKQTKTGVKVVVGSYWDLHSYVQREGRVSPLGYWGGFPGCRV